MSYRDRLKKISEETKTGEGPSYRDQLVGGGPKRGLRLKGKIPGFGPDFPPETPQELKDMLKEVSELSGRGMSAPQRGMGVALKGLASGALAPLVGLEPIKKAQGLFGPTKMGAKAFVEALGPNPPTETTLAEEVARAVGEPIVAQAVTEPKPKWRPPGTKEAPQPVPSTAPGFGAQSSTITAPHESRDVLAATAGSIAGELVGSAFDPMTYVYAKAGSLLPGIVNDVVSDLNTKGIKAFTINPVTAQEATETLNALQGRGERVLSITEATPRQREIWDAFQNLEGAGQKAKMLKEGGAVKRTLSIATPKRTSFMGIQLPSGSTLTGKEAKALSEFVGNKWNKMSEKKFTDAFNTFLDTGEAPNTALRTAFTKVKVESSTRIGAPLTKAPAPKGTPQVETRQVSEARAQGYELGQKDPLAGLKTKFPREYEGTGKTLQYVDIDNFKRDYNRTWGHPFGDEVIIRVGQHLQKFMQDVRRTGGEEFTGIVKGNGKAIPPMEITLPNGEKGVVTFSSGSIKLEKGLSIDEAYARVDDAQYASKEAGKNQHTVWKEGLPQNPDRVGQARKAPEPTAPTAPPAPAEGKAPEAPKPVRVPAEQIVADELKALVSEGKTEVSYRDLYNRIKEKHGIFPTGTFEIQGYNNNYFPKAVNDALKLGGIQAEMVSGGPGGVPTVRFGAPLEAPAETPPPPETPAPVVEEPPPPTPEETALVMEEAPGKRGLRKVSQTQADLRHLRQAIQGKIRERADQLKMEHEGKKTEHFSPRSLQVIDVREFGKDGPEITNLMDYLTDKRLQGRLSMTSGTPWSDYLEGTIHSEWHQPQIKDPDDLWRFLKRKEAEFKTRKPDFLAQALAEYQKHIAEKPLETWRPTGTYLRERGVDYRLQMSLFKAQLNPVNEALQWIADKYTKAPPKEDDLVLAHSPDPEAQKKAVNRIIAEQIPKIHRMILKRGGAATLWEQDAFSGAMEGVLQAIDGYDSSKGPWENYVTRAIRNRIVNAIISHRKQVPTSIPATEQALPGELEMVVNPFSRAPDATLAYADMVANIRDMLGSTEVEHLSPSWEGETVEMRKTALKVFDLLEQGYNGRSISRMLNLTKGRVSQLIHVNIKNAAVVVMKDVQTRLPMDWFKEEGVRYEPGMLRKKRPGVAPASPGVESPPAPMTEPSPSPAFIAEGKPVHLPKVISGPDNALEFFRQFEDLSAEHVSMIAYLDDGTVLTQNPVVYIGTVNGVRVNVNELFTDAQIAAKGRKYNVCLAHNHPSADVTPSPDDLDLTEKVKKYAELLGNANFVESFIVSKEGWFGITKQGRGRWGTTNLSEHRGAISSADMAALVAFQALPGKTEKYTITALDVRGMPKKTVSLDHEPLPSEIADLMTVARPSAVVIGHFVPGQPMNETVDKNLLYFYGIEQTFALLVAECPIVDKILHSGPKQLPNPTPYYSMQEVAVAGPKISSYTMAGESPTQFREGAEPYSPFPREDPLDFALEEARRYRLGLTPEENQLYVEMKRTLAHKQGLLTTRLPREVDVNALNFWMTPQTVIPDVWDLMMSGEEARVERVKVLAETWSPLMKRFKVGSPVDQAIAYISDGQPVPQEIQDTLDANDEELITEVVKNWRELHWQLAEEEGLPVENRKTEYLPHIFEGLFNLDKKYASLAWLQKPTESLIPSELFEPYLKERKNMPGYRMSFKTAFALRLKYGLRKIYYEPVIQRAKAIAQTYPPNKIEYAADWIGRILGKPSREDKWLKPIADGVNASSRAVIGRDVMSNVAPGAQMSRAVTRVYINAYLGLALDSALKNLTQLILTVSRLGWTQTAKGAMKIGTEEGQRIIDESGALREFVNIMERETGVTQAMLDKLESVNLSPFQFTEWINKSVSVVSAHDAAMKTLGEDFDVEDPGVQRVAEKASTDVDRHFVGDTQFYYGVFGTSPYLQGPIARTSTQFLSFPMKLLESLINYSDLWGLYWRWRQRMAYRELYRATPEEARGEMPKKMPKPEREYAEGAPQPKFFFRWLLICGAAMEIGHKLGIDLSEIFGTKIFPTMQQMGKGASPALQNIGLIMDYMKATNPWDKEKALEQFRRRHTWRYPLKVYRVASRQAQGGIETTKRGAVVKYSPGADMLWLLGYRSTTPPETLETFGPEGP